MTSDEGLIERLLYEEEGEALDKKRDQYKFTKASDEEKSELLKDILAFANSWRRTDAFIVIGIQEVKGERSLVFGISELLDDAALQQFVNSKTNRPVQFSYRNVSFEEKHLGLIHIPIHRRPIYLKKDFGRLRAKAVYVRRGSSTAIADIDEISKLGLESSFEHGTPDLAIRFSDPQARTLLDAYGDMFSLVLDVPRDSEIPNYSYKSTNLLEASLYNVNSSYYRQLAKFTRLTRLLTPLYFAVTNSGTVTAHDVQIELAINKCGRKIIVCERGDYPSEPQRTHDKLFLLDKPLVRVPSSHSYKVTELDSQWIIEASVGKAQPKATCWLFEPLYIGSLDSRQVTIEATLFSDQLHNPVRQALTVNICSKQRKVDLQGILALERERYESSAEYKHLMKKLKKDKDK